MYILYGNVAGWKELDRSQNELDVFDTLRTFAEGNTECFVVHSTDVQDEVIAMVRTYDDFLTYKAQVYNRCLVKKQK